MTARQKAKLEQESRMYMDIDEILPSAHKKPDLTEEEILKRAEKSRRRKLQQDQKMEEHKHATIQRLLMKQGAKSKKMKLEQMGEGNASVESLGNALVEEKPFEGCRYVDSKDTTCLVITNEKTFEQVFAPIATPKAELSCSVPGCHNPKKYTHAKSDRPVCSLQCYKAIC